VVGRGVVLQCHHEAVLSADAWPDHVPVPTFGPRMAGDQGCLADDHRHRTAGAGPMMAFERVGAVMAIVRATAVGKATKPGRDAAQTAPESRQGGAGRADQASAIPQRREGSGASARLPPAIAIAANMPIAEATPSRVSIGGDTVTAMAPGEGPARDIAHEARCLLSARWKVL
jgi:hypothetical protein